MTDTAMQWLLDEARADLKDAKAKHDKVIRFFSENKEKILSQDSLPEYLRLMFEDLTAQHNVKLKFLALAGYFQYLPEMKNEMMESATVAHNYVEEMQVKLISLMRSIRKKHVN